MMRNVWPSECCGIKTFVINIFLKVIYLCKARAPKLVFYKTLLNKPKPQFLLWDLGLSTGRAGSVFDPTRTRPAGVGWRGGVTRNRPPEKSVGSVFCHG